MQLVHPLLNSSKRISTPIRTGGTSGRIGSFGPTRVNTDGTIKMHKGIDLLSVEGWPVFAANAGIVSRVGWENAENTQQGYGQRLYITHAGDEEVITRYAHLQVIYVTQGVTVYQGDVIGRIGRTGNVAFSTPTHLHFEVRINGTPTDPEVWLKE